MSYIPLAEELYCPKCMGRIPPKQIACACILAMNGKPKVKRVKPKPDSLLEGVPGIDPYHLPEPKYGGRK